MAMQIGHRLAPPRFLVFTIAFVVGLAVAIPLKLHYAPAGYSPLRATAHGAMIAFDLAAAIFLVLIVQVLRHGGADEMRRASQANDANRAFLLIVTVVTTTIIMVAVVTEKLDGDSSPFVVALVLTSLTLAWIFSNTVYALHYAHLYYLPAQDGEDSCGINFPDCDDPDYWDFVYFSFTLGMTFQTSDVEIRSRRMRRIVTGHCLAAFVFNLGVLAFTINSIGGG